MKNNWKEVKLGDICKFSNGKKPYFNRDGIFHVFGANGPYGFSKESNAHSGNIVIGRVGAYCGSLYYLEHNAWVTDNAIIGIPKFDRKFLFYLLQTKKLNRLAQGAAQPLLNQNILNKINILLPPLDEQKRIADILSSFDDKIELLQKQNKTLEDMAKAIFKSWFVDFDIVKAKERKEKKFKILNEYKITEEIYNLFPDTFENSELGKIPKGWEMKPTNALLEFNIGGGWGNDENTNDFKMPAFVIRGTDIPKIKLSGNISDVPYRYHKESNFNSRKLINGDIILEIAGGSKGQPVGRALLITPYIIQSLQNAICASFCKLLRVNNTIYSSNIFYYFLELMYETLEIEQYQVQSTGIINFQFEYFLTNKFFVVPNINIIKKFDNIITDITNKMDNNKYQIQTLTEIRDTLLPKLVSGAIKI